VTFLNLATKGKGRLLSAKGLIALREGVCALPFLFCLTLADFVTLSSLRRPTFWGEGQKVGRRRLDKVTKSTKVYIKRKGNRRRHDQVK